MFIPLALICLKNGYPWGDMKVRLIYLSKRISDVGGKHLHRAIFGGKNGENYTLL